jgi:ethanolamine utilization protein EutA
LSDTEKSEIAKFIWTQETIELKTVGIDIGSSTSHLMFARVVLQRQSQGLSSRFVVIDRQVIWRSPIMLTPFLIDGTIDAHSLSHFVQDAYADAGLEKNDIDSGAVILTGEAIKRKNARAIDELFAAEAGKFVCATAGHALEARLAAQGSGALRLSKERGICVLHVDIGGGTTKLALINQGVVVGLSAFAVGGRLLAVDTDKNWTRVDDSARLAADDLGLAISPETAADPSVRLAIVRRLAQVAVDYILDTPRDRLGKALQLIDDLPRNVAPAALTFSGGVSEYIFGREKQEFGDIALPLAGELVAELTRRTTLPMEDPGHRIRATVMGASQFTVQVSGKTIYISDPGILPVHNVPVVYVGNVEGLEPPAIVATVQSGLKKLDLNSRDRMAIAFSWHGDPEYSRLASLARAIIDAIRGASGEALFLMIDGDIGRTIGQILHQEFGISRPLVSIDAVQLQDLDYVDVGELATPPGVVPVVIKSLLFS